MNATDAEIFQLVEAWIDDLARGDYKAAFARTKHDPYYGWTPELMEAVVNGYGLPEPHQSGVRYLVTPRAEARGRLHRAIDRSAPPETAVPEVWHDLPLNGDWSDLTVTFRVEETSRGIDLVLQQIHVF
jgi:hypothetical protein